MNKHLDALKEGGMISLPVYAQGGEVKCDSCEETLSAETDGQYGKGGWIQKAVNPAHKGWCTPLSNPHCTGHRRALALRFKHGLKDGGEVGQYMGMYDGGGGVGFDDPLARMSSPSYYGSNSNFSENQNYVTDWRNPANYPAPENTPQTALQPNTGTPSYQAPSYLKDNQPDSYGTKDWYSKPQAQRGIGRDSFERNQNIGTGMQALGIANNLIESFQPVENIKPQKINALQPKYISSNTGARAALGAYRSGKRDLRGNLPGLIEQNSQFQGNEADRLLKISDMNSSIYNQYAGQNLNAQQFNSQADLEAQKTRLMGRAAGRQYRGQALADAGKLGQNRMNNELYYQYLKSI